jgi:hypothetical protein
MALMVLSLLNTLAQAQSSAGPLAAFLGVVLVLVTGVAAWQYFDQKKTQAALENRIRGMLAERSQQPPPQDDSRNQVMFEQHRRMNDLQIAKLSAEVELLQRQVKGRELDEDRIEASKEYHELMVEKTKLEMDSLRLHIAELRKRMEDWRSDPD